MRRARSSAVATRPRHRDRGATERRRERTVHALSTAPAVGSRVSRAISRAGVVVVVKTRHTSTSRERARAALGVLDREPRMQPCSTCSGGGRRGRTRRRRRRGSSRASQAARRRSKTQPRARAGATSREAVVRTGSSRARPSRVPDAHASAMIPRRLGAAAASAAPPTGALRGVLIDQSALPTTRVEEDQCSAAPSLSSRPSLRT